MPNLYEQRLSRIVVPLQLIILLLLSESTLGQQELVVTKFLEIGGKNIGAGVELINPSVTLLNGTQVWIADEGQFKVIVVDVDNGHVETLGRRGQGPAEYQTLAALTLLPENRVAVLDVINLRISILQQSSEGLSFVRSIPLPIASSKAIGVLSGAFLIAGSYNGKLLHVLDERGQILHSFGVPYRIDLDIGEMRLSDRTCLSCIPQTDSAEPVIIAASLEFGEVHAFTREGAEMWSVSLPGFRPVEASPNSRGGITYRMPPEGSYHVTSSLLTTDDGQLFVQVAEVSAGMSWDEASRVTTHELSARSGEVLSTSQDIPKLDYLQGNFAVGIENVDYPLVNVYRINP